VPSHNSHFTWDQLYTVLDHWNPDVNRTPISRATRSRDGSNPNESRQRNSGLKIPKRKIPKNRGKFQQFRMKMKRLKLTRIERCQMGRGRRRWCRSRGREVTLHPCHDALDSIEGAQGLALPLSAIEGRPKAIAPGIGAWTAIRVPIGWCPRGLPRGLPAPVGIGTPP
jgi:hypothetical protein